jgi:hypothetical protein
MKFNDRNYALLGIPDLPINAFKHIGDRKIKPQGGISSIVDSVTGAVDDQSVGVLLRLLLAVRLLRQVLLVELRQLLLVEDY